MTRDERRVNEGHREGEEPRAEHESSYEPYCPIRADNEERWSFITDHLSDEHRTALDIGCAEGHIANAAAEHGLVVTAIEAEKERYDRATAAFGATEGLTFEHRTVTPDNVAELPVTDVTFLLTVQHHWAGAYGADAADAMLATVARKTDHLYYEPPGTMDIGKEISLDPEESVEHYDEYLADVLGESATILDVELFAHVNEGEYVDRRDPLFVVDASGV